MRVRARYLFISLFTSVFLIASCGNSSQVVAIGDKCDNENLHAHIDATNQEVFCQNVNGGLHWALFNDPSSASQESTNSQSPVVMGSQLPTPLLESLPIDVRAVDWKSTLKFYKTYGNFETKNFPLLPFGLEESPGGQRDPQPGFYAPLGTDVLAPVTSTVIAIKQLEHGDWTIMYAPTEKGTDIWETEHIIDAIVKVGDKVVAGQVVAKVSDVDCKMHESDPTNGYCKSNLGLVELGYLVGNSITPTHLCPFEESRIDPAKSAQIIADYTWAMDQAEAAKGSKYMGRDKWVTPTCEVTDGITG